MFILANSSSGNGFFQLLVVTFIFVFVLALCVWTTKFVGSFAKSRSNNKNLKVVETIGVGPNKMISIIEAGKKYLVVSIAKDEIRLLSELTREELIDFSFEKEDEKFINTQESFQQILEKLKEKIPKK